MTQVFLESPYSNDATLRLKGNLHTHTTCSDGQASPEEAVAHYAKLGYDFLQLSDHDTLALLPSVIPHDFLVFLGTELSCCGSHILDVGATQVVSTAVDRQPLLDNINATSGFPVLCHPSWGQDFNHFPYDVMFGLKGYVGIEIFNGTVLTQPGNHLALDKWDRLLSAGRRIWGFANDDMHDLAEAGRGWNVAFVRERTIPAILEALRRGSFYASSGVTIEHIVCEESRLRLFAPDAECIIVVGQYGARLHLARGPVLELDSEELAGPYFRIECVGRCGAMAWTQPFYIRGGRYEKMLERLARIGAAEKATLQAFRSSVAPRLTGTGEDL
ncbi:MAG: hypothetical protein N2255_03550, partial [Kiritimatiellae bacterium]|nr:hypothetical protein [Kiritimatiellia bacterium]